MTMAPKPRLVDDPNTFIPPAVRRHAEAADAAFRAQGGQPEAPLEAPSSNSPGAAPPPQEATPPVEKFPEVTSQVTPPISQQVTPPVAPPEDEETWQRRYEGILGRYKRQENDMRGMSEQIMSMQNLIASMQHPVAAPAESRPQSLLTPEEVNEYGSEFLGVVARKAKEELNPEVAALRQKLINLEQQLQGNSERQQERARLEMDATLDQRIPHWREINYLPEFHAWLALPDMYSGVIKHELLRTAYAQNNTPRVLAFFKGFLDQEAALVPQGGEPHPATELQNGGKVPLESLAAPGRAKTSAASSAPVEKPLITRAQISQFYTDSASGKYRGREAEKGRLEAMIFDAEREGRIR
jgi:hypothetical protein